MGEPRVHPVAEAGFDRGAAAYERWRPSYPAAAVDHLVSRLTIGPDATVLDLGAGTGKLTRLLLPSGATVVAVEPLAGMRAALVEATPGVDVLDGTAEAIPWADEDADAVVAGQAFHWFDADAALAEIHRVLRAGGGLGLIWNVRDERVGWVAALSQILLTVEGDTPRERWGTWRDAFECTTLFTPLEEATFEWTQPTDAGGLVDLIATRSVVAMQPEGVRAGVLDEVRALAAALAEPIEIPYVTSVYTCSRR